MWLNIEIIVCRFLLFPMVSVLLCHEIVLLSVEEENGILLSIGRWPIFIHLSTLAISLLYERSSSTM